MNVLGVNATTNTPVNNNLKKTFNNVSFGAKLIVQPVVKEYIVSSLEKNAKNIGAPIDMPKFVKIAEKFLGGIAKRIDNLEPKKQEIVLDIKTQTKRNMSKTSNEFNLYNEPARLSLKGSNPEKFLKSDSINKLKNNAQTLKDSKAYSLATQLFKLGIGFAVVLPKAILTALGIPIILDNCFTKPNKNKPTIDNNGLTFQGKANDKLAKGLGKILNNKYLQDFAVKYKDSNFPMHIFALKDIFATTAFVSQAKKNNKINNEQKPFLIKNSIISTVLSIISSYTIDKLTDKQAEKIINKIKIENINDPKLAKYLEGFKIIKPIFILAFVYYTIIPMISTFLAQRSENITKKVQ